MPIPLRDTHRQNLMLIRQIFDRAIKQSERPYGFADGILALIGFDLANESAIKAVYSAVSGRPQPPTDKSGRFLTFHGIIEKTDEELAKKNLPAISRISDIEFVHTRRNESQHSAVSPNDSVLRTAQVHTNDFLIELVRNVWNEEFFSINLVDLIRHEFAKELLIKANEKIKAGDYTDSAFDSVAAFQKLSSPLHSKSPVLFRRPMSVGSQTEEMNRIVALERDVQRLALLQLYILSGFDLGADEKYRTISKGIIVNWFGEREYRGTLTQGDLTKDEAQYLLDYAAEAGMRIEDFLTSFENPFGLKTPV